jgi:hypothetical protein
MNLCFFQEEAAYFLTSSIKKNCRASCIQTMGSNDQSHCVQKTFFLGDTNVRAVTDPQTVELVGVLQSFFVNLSVENRSSEPVLTHEYTASYLHTVTRTARPHAHTLHARFPDLRHTIITIHENPSDSRGTQHLMDIKQRSYCRQHCRMRLVFDYLT